MNFFQHQPGAKSTPPDKGFSLVEVMVALTVGLLLITGVLKIFSSTKQTYLLNESMARLQENARFALEIMSREIRMAGYWGCVSNITPINVLVTPNNFSWAFNDKIRGFDNSNYAGLPTALQSYALTGTDAIVVSGMDPNPFTIESHNPCAAQFKIAQSHDLNNDEVVCVTDCMQAAIFQITNANQANQTIVHNTGTGTIGNTTKCLGGNCGGNCASAWYAYGPNAMLVRIRTVAFYIGTGTSGEPALFWKILNRGSTTNQAELVDGVENLQILYGRDTDSDKVANQYLTADVVETANAWANIVSVRIGLLMRTSNNLRSQLDTNSYTIAGMIVPHPTDTRIRKVVTTTIQLRN